MHATTVPGPSKIGTITGAGFPWYLNAVSYSNTSHDLKLLAPVSLEFYGVTTGCGTLFGSTDTATYTATHPVTPTQTIT